MEIRTQSGSAALLEKRGFAGWRDKVARDMRKNWATYLLAIPGLLFYIIFMYGPMYGIIIAFKDYSPAGGILGSQWVGLEQFIEFFTSPTFNRIFFNTIILNVLLIIFTFPTPIILALMLNEVRCMWFKKTVQTITYLPHFISLVVICGMIVDFTNNRGFITEFVNLVTGADHGNLLQDPSMFRPIYVISDIWQKIGWDSIIYLAAMAGLDMELYEAAEIDGAGKWRQLFAVTLPGIASTIVIMLILRIGSIMSLGADKVILLYNPVTYDTADIISSYIYRKGLIDSDYSFSAAVGLFNSAINCVLVYAANYFSRKFSDNSLW